jgi:hypothetical protein
MSFQSYLTITPGSKQTYILKNDYVSAPGSFYAQKLPTDPAGYNEIFQIVSNAGAPLSQKTITIPAGHYSVQMIAGIALGPNVAIPDGAITGAEVKTIPNMGYAHLVLSEVGVGFLLTSQSHSSTAITGACNNVYMLFNSTQTITFTKATTVGLTLNFAVSTKEMYMIFGDSPLSFDNTARVIFTQI